MTRFPFLLHHKGALIFQIKRPLLWKNARICPSLIAGVLCVCFGITLVAFSQAEAPGSFLGVLLCFVAQAFQAGMLVVEEKFLGDFHVAPLYAVGLEGLYGCFIMSGVIPIASNLGQENIE